MILKKQPSWSIKSSFENRCSLNSLLKLGKANIYAYVKQIFMLTSYTTPYLWDASCTIRVALPVAGLKVLVAANFECRKLFPTFSYIKAYKICLIVAKLVCTSFL